MKPFVSAEYKTRGKWTLTHEPSTVTMKILFKMKVHLMTRLHIVSVVNGRKTKYTRSILPIVLNEVSSVSVKIK